VAEGVVEEGAALAVGSGREFQYSFVTVFTAIIFVGAFHVVL